MKLLIQRCTGCLKPFYISLLLEKEHQGKMGFPPCWLSLMLPIYHFTNWLLGRLLGAIIVPLRGEAGGSSQLRIRRQVNHLLGKEFLLQSLCGLSVHFAAWLILTPLLSPCTSFYSPFPSRKRTESLSSMGCRYHRPDTHKPQSRPLCSSKHLNILTVVHIFLLLQLSLSFLHRKLRC